MARKQAKVTICGRADPKSIAITARLILRGLTDHSLNISRSELISYAFDICAHIAQTSGVPGFEWYEDAFLYLETLGITWEGEKFEREREKAFQIDSMEDLSDDQVQDIKELITKFRRENTKRKLDMAAEDDDGDEISLEDIEAAARKKK